MNTCQAVMEMKAADTLKKNHGKTNAITAFTLHIWNCMETFLNKEQDVDCGKWDNLSIYYHRI